MIMACVRAVGLRHESCQPVRIRRTPWAAKNFIAGIPASVQGGYSALRIVTNRHPRTALAARCAGFLWRWEEWGDRRGICYPA